MRSKLGKNSVYNLVYIGVAILAIIALVLGYKIVKQQQAARSVNTANQSKIATQAAQQSANSLIPIPSDHPNVVQKPRILDNAIIYAINGEVDQFNDKTGELSLKSKGTPLPIFKIAPDVAIVKAVDSTKSEPSSLSNIRGGVLITIIVMFDKTAKTYTITHITIL